jgi:hypothetical protein
MIAIQAAESSVPPEAGAERHLRRRLCRLSLSGKISVETIMPPDAERKGICGNFNKSGREDE